MGMGASTYRLGRVLRRAAGLRHGDPAWESIEALFEAETASVIPPEQEPDFGHVVASPETPGADEVIPPPEQGLPARKADRRDTPELRNWENLSSTNDLDVDVDEEGTSYARARDELDAIERIARRRLAAEDANQQRVLAWAFPD